MSNYVKIFVDMSEEKKKKPIDESRIHEGHRQRLLKTVMEAGFSNVSEVQAMEFILFYIFPRGDVNPLAHRLLHEFGSVANVLEADVNSLKEIKGMGERSACSLKMLGEMFFYYTQNKLSQKIVLKNYQAITDYFDEMLRFCNTEIFVVVALDSSFNLTHKKVLAKGSARDVGISPMSIANFISSSNPAFVLFAHNHPGGSAKASTQDVNSNNSLSNLVEYLGVKFVDHIIVGKDGIYSIKKDEFLRNF